MLGGVLRDREAFGSDALPDQVDPLHQVAVDAPACDAGSRNWCNKLSVKREIADCLGPGIGNHDADRAEMTQQGVGIRGRGRRRADGVVRRWCNGWLATRHGRCCLCGRQRWRWRQQLRWDVWCAPATLGDIGGVDQQTPILLGYRAARGGECAAERGIADTVLNRQLGWDA